MNDLAEQAKIYNQGLLMCLSNRSTDSKLDWIDDAIHFYSELKKSAEQLKPGKQHCMLINSDLSHGNLTLGKDVIKAKKESICKQDLFDDFFKEFVVTDNGKCLTITDFSYWLYHSIVHCSQKIIEFMIDQGFITESTLPIIPLEAFSNCITTNKTFVLELFVNKLGRPFLNLFIKDKLLNLYEKVDISKVNFSTLSYLNKYNLFEIKILYWNKLNYTSMYFSYYKNLIVKNKVMTLQEKITCCKMLNLPFYPNILCLVEALKLKGQSPSIDLSPLTISVSMALVHAVQENNDSLFKWCLQQISSSPLLALQSALTNLVTKEDKVPSDLKDIQINLFQISLEKMSLEVAYAMSIEWNIDFGVDLVLSYPDLKLWNFLLAKGFEWETDFYTKIQTQHWDQICFCIRHSTESSNQEKQALMESLILNQHLTLNQYNRVKTCVNFGFYVSYSMFKKIDWSAHINKYYGLNFKALDLALELWNDPKWKKILLTYDMPAFYVSNPECSDEQSSDRSESGTLLPLTRSEYARMSGFDHWLKKNVPNTNGGLQGREFKELHIYLAMCKRVFSKRLDVIYNTGFSKSIVDYIIGPYMTLPVNHKVESML